MDDGGSERLLIFKPGDHASHSPDLTGHHLEQLDKLAAACAEPKLAVRAAGKFAYAHDLAPNDLQALRAAAFAAAAGPASSGKAADTSQIVLGPTCVTTDCHAEIPRGQFTVITGVSGGVFGPSSSGTMREPLITGTMNLEL